jgi:gamma-glutamyltranspeptidase/glutathione hydrolase
MKLAYADVYRYDADPRFAKVPVKRLLAKDYVRERAKLIDPEKANCDVSYGTPMSDTTYLSVVDRGGQYRVAHPE